METKNVKKETTTIEVVDNAAFGGDMKTELISSIEMAEIVSSLFMGAMADYAGCAIRVNDGNTLAPAVQSAVPYGAIYVDLYFKDKGSVSEDGPIKSLYSRTNPKAAAVEKDENGKVINSNLASRFAAVNAIHNTNNAGRVYTVSKETYEALNEFAFTNNVRWFEHTQEISTNMGPIGNKEEVVVCISGLDLNKILTKIYGAKTEDGVFEYRAVPATVIPNRNREFIMQVTQLNTEAVRKLARELGIYNPNNPYFHSC